METTNSKELVIKSKSYDFDETVNNNYMKNYYTNNKDKFKEWSKKKIYCECCNKYITAPNYATHCKSVKHILNSKNKDNDKTLQLISGLTELLNNKELMERIASIEKAIAIPE
jgi:hypothetical protein